MNGLKNGHFDLILSTNFLILHNWFKKGKEGNMCPLFEVSTVKLKPWKAGSDRVIEKETYCLHFSSVKIIRHRAL